MVNTWQQHEERGGNINCVCIDFRSVLQFFVPSLTYTFLCVQLFQGEGANRSLGFAKHTVDLQNLLAFMC